jgi:GNAT superfamily N-acetyltransferase
MDVSIKKLDAADHALLPSVYHSASEVYLYDFAVLARWQRKGVGTLLLQALIEDCRKMRLWRFLFRQIFPISMP